MAKGTISFTQSATSGSYIDGEIRWESKPDASTGTSVVTASLYVRKANTAMTLTEYTTGTWSYKLTIDGTTWTGSLSKSVLQDWVLLTTRTSGNILHGAGGSKSITISGSITAPSGTSFAGHSTSGNATVALDTITRATTLDSWTCSSSYVDGTITANYTPRNSGYYNRCIIYVNVNGALTEIHRENLGQKATSQQKYTVKFDVNKLSKIYAVVKNTAVVYIRVTFQTYSNSSYTAQIGNDQSLEKTLLIPLAIAPTAALTVTPVNSNAWIKGKNIYVAGLSGATAVLSSKAGEGAKLTSTAITYDGTTSDSGGTEVHTVNVATLKKPGNISFSAKATDSRGRTAASTPNNITVLQYSAPAVSRMQIERGTYSNGWTADDNGKDVKLVFKTTLSLTDYDNAYKATFKIDGSTKTPINSTTTGLDSATEYTAYFSNIDGEASHTLTLTATDSVGKTGTAKLTIPTVHITMEFNDSGQGIAFGKTSEKDAFECAWDAEFHGTVKRIRDDGSILSLDDTGWIDLGISDSVTTTSSASAGHYNGCAYRVVNGNHVYVAFNVRAEYSGNAVIVSGNPIPTEHRPKLQPYAIVTLNGKRVSRILVSRTTGHAMIDWIHNVDDTAEPDTHTATWIDGYVDYWI